MNQPLVPLYFAVTIIVIQSMLVYTITSDQALNLPPYVNYILGVATIGLTSLAAALNIKTGQPNPPSPPEPPKPPAP